MACAIIGEISNFKHHTSGHLYLTLKDDKSRLRAVMFASRVRYLNFRPEDGMRVIVTGNVGVFERDGQVQMYIDEMQPDGVGALYVAFTQLKEKLQRDGLFDVSRKRALVRYPSAVGVVTSPTGAVIRDICSTLERRYPLVKVVLAPAKVQGPGAADTIVQALQRLERYARTVAPLDAIVVARGGGSIEELWPFNEEVVARAIASCSIPVVSAVGHETDFTISDFAADVRAATPTAAAEVIAPSMAELYATLDQLHSRTNAALATGLQSTGERLRRLSETSVLRNPLRIVDVARQHLDYQESHLHHVAKRPLYGLRKTLNLCGERLYQLDLRRHIIRQQGRVAYIDEKLRNDIVAIQNRHNQRFNEAVIRLEGLNPLQLLRRGYSVVSRRDNGAIVNSVRAIEKNMALAIRVFDGTFIARVESSSEEEEYDAGEYQQGRLDL